MNTSVVSKPSVQLGKTQLLEEAIQRVLLNGGQVHVVHSSGEEASYSVDRPSEELVFED
mgnify:CR=1 FL=1